MKNYEYLLKFRRELDLSYENVEKLPFYPCKNGNVLPTDVAIDSFIFFEAVIEFEREYGETAFTKVLDRDVGLVALLKYCISVYLDENNYEDTYIPNLDFFEWVSRSLKEIQDAIDNEEYVQCSRCLSIIPTKDTGILNYGFYTGKTLCKKCIFER